MGARGGRGDLGFLLSVQSRSGFRPGKERVLALVEPREMRLRKEDTRSKTKECVFGSCRRVEGK